MKKLLTILFASFLLAASASCGDKKSKTTEAKTDKTETMTEEGTEAVPEEEQK